MNIILLSGGCGKRLWPLSTENRSKQFLKIIKNEDGSYESMLQHMYRIICSADDNVSVTVATSENQVDTIREQIGDNVHISVEKCRRNTFPAIALAVAYLHDVQGVSEDEVVIVCPVDSYIGYDYAKILRKLNEEAQVDGANLILMGVEPTYPSEKFGYIIPETIDSVSFVKHFKEKPDAATAVKYIKDGALWNCGVFAFRMSYVLSIAEKVFSSARYQFLADNYSKMESISFDYAVVEKEETIKVVRFSGTWNDIGTWDSLMSAMNVDTIGDSTVYESKNTQIINELPIPIMALGVNNLAIVATSKGILVVDKDSAENIKDYIE